jgi:CheY-like chemotaxis protein
MATPRKAVLIADDNEDVSDLLQELLESAGYVVHVAADGEEALAQFHAKPIDLVVTDMRMPKVGGLQVLRAIKAEQPAVPVILLTGQSAGENDADEARQMGAFACLSKPLKDIHLLTRLVAMALATCETA